MRSMEVLSYLNINKASGCVFVRLSKISPCFHLNVKLIVISFWISLKQ